MESIESGTGQLAQGELAKTPEAPEANSFRFTPAQIASQDVVYES
jgi:hypothetical protein